MNDILNECAFPRLTPDEIACIAELGTIRQFKDGELLFECGQKDFSFFVVKSGAVVIIDTSSGEPREVVTHTESTFTGDVDVLTGRPAVISAQAKGDCEVYEVSCSDIRRVLHLVPGLSDKLLIAFQVRRELLEASGFVGIRVVGRANSKESLAIREFLQKNKVPHTFQDVESDTGRASLDFLGLSADAVPVVACNKSFQVQPSLAQVADSVGISREIKDLVYDMVIVGAGPAGLAASVYAASEGLKTLVLDRVGPGGQAGQSSKIENYMGFPAGIAGADLANRGYLQALKFGAHFSAPVSVCGITRNGSGVFDLELCSGEHAKAKTVLIATGASYQRLPLDNCDRFEGAGVHYLATPAEARLCAGATAIVVGGGNSAGQAAMFLSEQAERVLIVVRGDDLRASMASYLVDRIEEAENIDVCHNTEIVELEGDDRLRSVVLHNRQTDERTTEACAGLFTFIGAKPHTEWLGGTVAADAQGFLLTGPQLENSGQWPLSRLPFQLETNTPGMFVAGDVRSGTTKRCAFAVGDGALAVTCVHQYLMHEAD